MKKIKISMDATDSHIYHALLAEDRDIFNRFFDPSTIVDRNWTCAAREKLKEMFQKYSGSNFDAFILRVYQVIQNNAIEMEPDKNRQDVSTQTQETVQQVEEEERSILNRLRQPPPRKIEFNVSDFILSQSSCLLNFQSDDNVQDELNEINRFPDKAGVEALASEDLQTIFKTILYLNKRHQYRVLYPR